MLTRLVVLAALVVAAAGLASKSMPDLLARFAGPPAAHTDADADATLPAAPSGAVVLSADPRGHFFLDATISGRTVRFMVDTGATTVALTAETARRLDLRPTRAEFSAAARTANGSLTVAPVMLGEIRVGTISVHSVEAAVMPDGALDENLLGMSFLKRLRRFEVNGGQLVLTP